VKAPKPRHSDSSNIRLHHQTVGGDAKNRMLTDALSRVFDGDDERGGDT